MLVVDLDLMLIMLRIILVVHLVVAVFLIPVQVMYRELVLMVEAAVVLLDLVDGEQEDQEVLA
jgi:hypothetical protein